MAQQMYIFTGTWPTPEVSWGLAIEHSLNIRPQITPLEVSSPEVASPEVASPEVASPEVEPLKVAPFV
ncbi:hypothetical protein JCM33374_g1043 [Metschnikowia sp. JCM 33374]|nr:hypothetical protein JCM33374_g1043 [Metschnikowia sp. JCM 33374]